MASSGKHRPNLKICIDNTEEPSDHDGSSESDDDPFADGIQIHGLGCGESDDDFEINVSINSIPLSKNKEEEEDTPESLKNPGPRIYENKGGTFITGIDVTSKEEQEKKIERGKRFGKQSEASDISEDAIQDLYDSLKIDKKSLEKNERGIRLNAIHLRGTDEMSTNDVFHFFKDFGPSSIEWIDDSSCNVVWQDEITPARAIIKLSSIYKADESDSSSSDEDDDDDMECEDNKEERPMETEKTEMLENGKPGCESADSKKSENKEDEDDYDKLDLMSSDEEAEEEKGKKDEENKENKETDVKDKSKNESSDGEIEEEKMDTENDKADGKADENKSHRLRKSHRHHRRKDRLNMPPGYWRLGQSCPKAKNLFLRFATKADKKLPGAERKSKYYQKYGNPNFGGLKGVISESKKQKLRSEKWRHVNDEVAEELEGMAELDPVLEDTEFDKHMETVEKERKQAAINRKLKERGLEPEIPPPLPLPVSAPRKRRYEEIYEEEYDSDLEEGEVVDSEEEQYEEEENIPEVEQDYYSKPESESKDDDDDEVDLQMELHALLEPPPEKRYMRMHADDEEEKIMAKRMRAAEAAKMTNDARSRIRSRKQDQLKTLEYSPEKKQGGDLRKRLESKRRENKKPKLLVEVTSDDDDLW